MSSMLLKQLSPINRNKSKPISTVALKNHVDASVACQLPMPEIKNNPYLIVQGVPKTDNRMVVLRYERLPSAQVTSYELILCKTRGGSGGFMVSVVDKKNNHIHCGGGRFINHLSPNVQFNQLNDDIELRMDDGGMDEPQNKESMAIINERSRETTVTVRLDADVVNQHLETMQQDFTADDVLAHAYSRQVTFVIHSMACSPTYIHSSNNRRPPQLRITASAKNAALYPFVPVYEATESLPHKTQRDWLCVQGLPESDAQASVLRFEGVPDDIVFAQLTLTQFKSNVGPFQVSTAVPDGSRWKKDLANLHSKPDVVVATGYFDGVDNVSVRLDVDILRAHMAQQQKRNRNHKGRVCLILHSKTCGRMYLHGVDSKNTPRITFKRRANPSEMPRSILKVSPSVTAESRELYLNSSSTTSDKKGGGSMNIKIARKLYSEANVTIELKHGLDVLTSQPPVSGKYRKNNNKSSKLTIQGVGQTKLISMLRFTVPKVDIELGLSFNDVNSIRLVLFKMDSNTGSGGFQVSTCPSFSWQDKVSNGKNVNVPGHPVAIGASRFPRKLERRSPSVSPKNQTSDKANGQPVFISLDTQEFMKGMKASKDPYSVTICLSSQACTEVEVHASNARFPPKLVVSFKKPSPSIINDPDDTMEMIAKEESIPMMTSPSASAFRAPTELRSSPNVLAWVDPDHVSQDDYSYSASSSVGNQDHYSLTRDDWK